MEEEEKVEVKVTWSFAWGLWWRWMLIGLAFMIPFYIIIFAIVGFANIAID